MADEPTPDAPKDKPDDTPELDKARAEAEKWKALARKHEDQAKSNADAAKRLAEIEDSQKSEIEKAAAKVAEAESRAAEAEAKALRMEIATEKGLGGKHLRYLSGATREELEANAAQLLEDFGTTDDAGDKPTPPSKPSEALKGGGDPSAAPSPDIRKIVDEIPRGGF